MIKAGTIIENDRGMFAKIVSVEDGRYRISPFFFKKPDAEKSETVARILNTYGLSQIVVDRKTEKAAPAAKKTAAKKTDDK